MSFLSTHRGAGILFLAVVILSLQGRSITGYLLPKRQRSRPLAALRDDGMLDPKRIVIDVSVSADEEEEEEEDTATSPQQFGTSEGKDSYKFFANFAEAASNTPAENGVTEEVPSAPTTMTSSNGSYKHGVDPIEDSYSRFAKLAQQQAQAVEAPVFHVAPAAATKTDSYQLIAKITGKTLPPPDKYQIISKIVGRKLISDNYKLVSVVANLNSNGKKKIVPIPKAATSGTDSYQKISNISKAATASSNNTNKSITDEDMSKVAEERGDLDMGMDQAPKVAPGPESIASTQASSPLEQTTSPTTSEERIQSPFQSSTSTPAEKKDSFSRSPGSFPGSNKKSSEAPAPTETKSPSLAGNPFGSFSDSLAGNSPNKNQSTTSPKKNLSPFANFSGKEDDSAQKEKDTPDTTINSSSSGNSAPNNPFANFASTFTKESDKIKPPEPSEEQANPFSSNLPNGAVEDSAQEPPAVGAPARPFPNSADSLAGGDTDKLNIDSSTSVPKEATQSNPFSNFSSGKDGDSEAKSSTTPLKPSNNNSNNSSNPFSSFSDSLTGNKRVDSEGKRQGRTAPKDVRPSQQSNPSSSFPDGISGDAKSPTTEGDTGKPPFKSPRRKGFQSSKSATARGSPFDSNFLPRKDGNTRAADKNKSKNDSEKAQSSLGGPILSSGREGKEAIEAEPQFNDEKKGENVARKTGGGFGTPSEPGSQPVAMKAPTQPANSSDSKEAISPKRIEKSFASDASVGTNEPDPVNGNSSGRVKPPDTPPPPNIVNQRRPGAPDRAKKGLFYESPESTDSVEDEVQVSNSLFGGADPKRKKGLFFGYDEDDDSSDIADDIKPVKRGVSGKGGRFVEGSDGVIRVDDREGNLPFDRSASVGRADTAPSERLPQPGLLVTEILVVALFVLGGLPVFNDPLHIGLGSLCMVAGLLFGVGMSVIDLGDKQLSPFPKPVDEGNLQSDGIYGEARHPMYAGVLGAALGLSIFTESPDRLFLTAILLWLLETKSRQEEKLLLQEFGDDYRAYKTAVPSKFVPLSVLKKLPWRSMSVEWKDASNKNEDDVLLETAVALNRLAESTPEYETSKVLVNLLDVAKLGKRGEFWFVMQALLMAAIVWGPPILIDENVRMAFGVAGLLGGTTLVALGLFGASDEEMKPFPRTNAKGGWGVYEAMRHPAEAGVLLTVFGTAVFTYSADRILLVMVLWYLLDAKMELRKEDLLREYGVEYEQYLEQVPNKFFPF